jgi:hypothetical protein
MVDLYSKDSIIQYGKSKGYSDRDINRALSKAKNSLVEYGIEQGYSGSKINKGLNKAGYDNYNPLFTKKNWENFIPNFRENAGEFARNARTISGQIIKPYIDDINSPKGERMSRMRDRFIKAITSDESRRTALGGAAGSIAGAVATPILRNIPVVKYLNPGVFGGGVIGALSGLMGGPKELGNAIASTYDTNLNEMWNEPGKAIQNIGQGAFKNPMYSTLDVMSIGGAKAGGKALEAIGNIVPETDNLALASILQPKKLRDFNKTATDLITSARSDNADMLGAFERLNSDPTINRLELAKDLITNDGKLNAKEKDISRAIKSAMGEAQIKLAANHILDIDKSINNNIAQYAMQKLRDKVPDIIQMDLNNYLETGNVSGRLAEAVAQNPALRQEVDAVINTARDLQKNGDLSYITQILVKSKDPRNEILAGQLAKEAGAKDYFSTQRYIGRGTYQEIADVLDESIKFQMSQISKALESNDVVKGLLKKGDIAELAQAKTAIPEGKIGISTKKLEEELAKQASAGGEIDISRALSRAKVSSEADNSTYILSKLYSKAIDNMFKEGPRGSGRHLLTAFKKSVLAQPHWIALNRAGNWTNMSMAGVGLNDIADAWNYRNIIPRQLMQQTSFNNYLGTTASGARTSTLANSLSKPWNNMGRAWKQFKNSDKTLEDIGKVVAETYSNISDTTANLFFNLESKAETMDRYADMIMHAKAMANKTGGKWQDIIKKANDDKSLFNKLNNEVNKDLGDYVGKNYALPTGYYTTLSETVPFYRFLTQTGRTSLHQLANHPMGIQSSVITPSRVGGPLSEQIIQDNKFDRDKYQGGVPYRKDPVDDSIRTIGGEPLPLQSVMSETIGGNGLDWLGLVSPGYKIVSDTLSYKKGGKYTPSSKRLSELKKSKNPKDQALAKNYKPTLGEQLAFGLQQGLSATLNPYAQMRTYIPEIYGTVTNKPIGRYYDASILPIPSNTNYSSPLRLTPAEQLMRWFGIQSKTNYKTKPKKPNKNSFRYSSQASQKEEKNKERIRNGR